MRRVYSTITTATLVMTALMANPVLAQTAPLNAESVRLLTESRFGVLSNSIANLHANGDSLWIGPYLNLTVDRGRTFEEADTDSLFGTPNRVFSLDVSGSVLLAGLGRNDFSTGDNVQTASGFLVSDDGGNTFEYRFPQLDQPGDSVIVYGHNRLSALPVIVPQQSPPFDVDVDEERAEFWVAAWASGVRRSRDSGRTWERVVLPPDNLDFIHPDSSYAFRVEPRRGGSGSLNHMGFAVLAASDGSIWAGTAGGVNRSLDGGQSWQRYRADGSAGSLTGSWVISIEEQRLASRSVIWMATWNTSEVEGERFGVTFTDDGGATFSQALQGERVYDFAFYGQTVYAAAENGLFISEDGGRFWESIREFRDRARPSKIVRPGSNVFSVERTRGTLWIGTSDGLLASQDGGSTWDIFRTEVPLHPGEETDRVPDVETFAYPNPFSPAGDGFIRIRYESSGTAAEIHIFDFGMNPVRTLRAEGGGGIVETRWDGRDSRGTRVANGVYFYRVDAGSGKARGKILVVE